MSISVQPMRDAMAWYDTTLAAIFDSQVRKGQPVPVTCTRGCSACCDEPLKVLEGEVDSILAGMTAEEKEDLKPRVLAWVNAAKAAKLNSVVEFSDRDLIVDGKRVNAYAYRALKLTCPLLKDGSCTAYANRPMGCRAFIACGPRSMCEDLAQRPHQKFVQIPELDDALTIKVLQAHDKAGYRTVAVSHLGYFLAVKLGLATEKDD